MVNEDRRTIGIIVAAHGLQGTAKVAPLTRHLERFFELESCFAVKDDETVRPLTIKRVKLAVQNVLISFHEIRTRDDIDELRGYELQILEKDSYRVPNEFFISDIVGFSGVDADGIVFGVLKAVEQAGQDRFLFDTPSGEILVPFVDEWITGINSELRTIAVPNWKDFLESHMNEADPSED